MEMFIIFASFWQFFAVFLCGNRSLLAGGSESFKHSRSGETRGIFTGIYRKGYPTSFSSWAFLLKSLELHLMDIGMDRRAAVFGKRKG